MIKTKMKGTLAVVTRTLDLPKSGGLKANQLQATYNIETGLSSKDAKNPVGQAILKKLPGVLDYGMNAVRGQYDKRNIKLWQEAGAALIKDGRTEKDAVKIAKAVDQKIAANWNAYNKMIERHVVSIVTNLHKSEEEKSDAKIKELKVKLSSPDLKPERVGMLTYLLDGVVFLTSGPVGWVAGGLSMIGKTAKGFYSGWKLLEKQSTDVQSSLNQMSDNLDAAVAALKQTTQYNAQLENAQRGFAAQTIGARTELNKMTKELEVLEKRAISEKAVREGGYLKDLRTATQDQHFKLIALEKTVDAQSDVINALQKAKDAVDDAKSLVSARRKGWGQVMSEYSKNSKDIQTLFQTLGKVIKKIG